MIQFGKQIQVIEDYAGPANLINPIGQVQEVTYNWLTDWITIRLKFEYNGFYYSKEYSFESTMQDWAKSDIINTLLSHPDFEGAELI